MKNLKDGSNGFLFDLRLAPEKPKFKVPHGEKCDRCGEAGNYDKDCKNKRANNDSYVMKCNTMIFIIFLFYFNTF